MLTKLTRLLLGPVAWRQRTARRYFGAIDPPTPNAKRVEEVRRAIEAQGYWTESIEWRISTEMTSRIEPVLENGKTWYRVTVSCDYELSARCPTLARALQFHWVYAALIVDMFWNLGWSSWASREDMQLESRTGRQV
jgi:hypothetical protein